jgi:TfoX/Sxy family transcriptional regulator of competence genes
MVYNEVIAGRMRELLAHEPHVTEKKMFGGLGFMIAGNMAIAASSSGGALVRVDPEQSDKLVDTTVARPMVMRGRPMSGWLEVPADALSSKREVARWVRIGATYAKSLPPK